VSPTRHFTNFSRNRHSPPHSLSCTCYMTNMFCVLILRSLLYSYQLCAWTYSIHLLSYSWKPCVPLNNSGSEWDHRCRNSENHSRLLQLLKKLRYYTSLHTFIPCSSDTRDDSAAIKRLCFTNFSIFQQITCSETSICFCKLIHVSILMYLTWKRNKYVHDIERKIFRAVLNFNRQIK
jgi:hypothetical protein